MAYRQTNALDMMDAAQQTNLDGLGFSLKPPAWLRNAVAGAVKNVPIVFTAQTPAGPVNVDVTKPDELRRLVAGLKPQVTVGKEAPSIPEQIIGAATSAGPALAIAAVGILGYILLTRKAPRA